MPFIIDSGGGDGIKKDPVWNHCVSIDGKTRNVKFKYCDKILTGDIYRLKHHLACTSKVPPIAEDDEGHGIDNINKNEDLVQEDDDYPSINMKDFL